MNPISLISLCAVKCLNTIPKDPDFQHIMKHTKMLEYIEWLNKVSRDGWVLEYVPDELKTNELCLAAVSNNGCALEYVPDELKTNELCLAAVSRNGWVLEYVPDELKTNELCLAAVSNCGYALQFATDEFIIYLKKF